MENTNIEAHEPNEVVKSELIVRITKKLPQWFEKDIDLGVDQVIEHLIQSLCDKKRVEIRGFGCFTVRYRAPRKAHNPRTGEKVVTQPKYAPHFKPGKDLRERVNRTIKKETETTAQ